MTPGSPLFRTAAALGPDVGPRARPPRSLALAGNPRGGPNVAHRDAPAVATATTAPAEGCSSAAWGSVVASGALVTPSATDPDLAHEAARIADATEPTPRPLTDEDVRAMATGLAMVHDLPVDEAERRIRDALARGETHLECP